MHVGRVIQYALFAVVLTGCKADFVRGAGALPSPTETVLPSATFTPMATATPTAAATATYTATNTATSTPTATSTSTATATSTSTATATSTSTPTATATATSTPTSTHTSTPTATPTQTPLALMTTPLDAAIDSAGRGYVVGVADTGELQLRRFLDVGVGPASADTLYGNAGALSLASPPAVDTWRANVALDGDNPVVTFSADFPGSPDLGRVLRLDSSGAPDPSFGTAGAADLSSSKGFDVAPPFPRLGANAGSVLVAAGFDVGIQTYSYDSAGSIPEETYEDFAGAFPNVNAVRVVEAPSGNIYVLANGSAVVPFTNDPLQAKGFAVAYNTTGNLNDGFASYFTQVQDGVIAQDLALDGTNVLVVATYRNGPGTDVLLGRFDAALTPDAAFSFSAFPGFCTVASVPVLAMNGKSRVYVDAANGWYGVAYTDYIAGMETPVERFVSTSDCGFDFDDKHGPGVLAAFARRASGGHAFWVYQFVGSFLSGFFLQ